MIVNKNTTLLKPSEGIYWLQAMTFDWFKQDLTNGGVQYITKEALPALRKRVRAYRFSERPETAMSRLEEFHNPRRFASSPLVCGLHGYKQDDMLRVRVTKERRGQEGYDWELARMIEGEL